MAGGGRQRPPDHRPALRHTAWQAAQTEPLGQSAIEATTMSEDVVVRWREREVGRLEHYEESWN